MWNPILFLLLLCVCSVCQMGKNEKAECHVISFYLFCVWLLWMFITCPLPLFSFLSSQISECDISSLMGNCSRDNQFGKQTTIENLVIYSYWTFFFFFCIWCIFFHISSFFGLANQCKSCFIPPWVFSIVPSKAQINICLLRIKDDFLNSFDRK